jgi:hypothetical protein
MKKYMKQILFTFLGLILMRTSFAGSEGMPSMPRLEPTKVRTVNVDDDLDAEKGFGDQAPMVKMMNLMMVEGSGMEGMSMDMSMDAPKQSAKTSAEKMDPGMKMAQNEQKLKPVTKSNLAQSNAVGTSSDQDYEISAKSMSGAVNVGTNTIEISILDSKNKKPVTGMKLKAQVFMTSMDMGTEEPSVKEVGAGKYQVKAPFAMKGPWAVRLILPNAKEKILNFDVQAKK